MSELIIKDNKIIRSLDIDDYHNHDSISSSKISSFLDGCPGEYYVKYIEKADHSFVSESKAASIGKLAHIALLEPDLFDNMYVVADKEIKKKTLKAWKEFEKSAKENNKKPLLYSEFEQTALMTAQIKRHKEAYDIIHNSLIECSFFAKDSDTGLIKKARPDILNHAKTLKLADYKTTAYGLGNDKTQFNHARTYKRHIQTAFHSDVVEECCGTKVREHIYIVQSSTFPYFIKLFCMPQDLIDLGRHEYKQAMEMIKRCYDKGIWPDYPHVITEYSYGDWYRSNIQEKVDEFNRCMGE